MKDKLLYLSRRALIKWEKLLSIIPFMSTKYLNWLIFNIGITALPFIIYYIVDINYITTTAFEESFLSYNFTLLVTSLFLIVDSIKMRPDKKDFYQSTFIIATLFWTFLIFGIYCIRNFVDPNHLKNIQMLASPFEMLICIYIISLSLTATLYWPIIKKEYNNSSDIRAEKESERRFKESETIIDESQGYTEAIDYDIMNNPEQY